MAVETGAVDFAPDAFNERGVVFHGLTAVEDQWRGGIESLAAGICGGLRSEIGPCFGDVFLHADEGATPAAFGEDSGKVRVGGIEHIAGECNAVLEMDGNLEIVAAHP